MKFSWKIALAKLNWITALSIFVSDQITKVLIVLFVPLHTRIEVLPFFQIVHTKNKGAAFGMFSDSSPIFRLIFFGAVSIACLYLLLYWLGTTPLKEFWQRFSLSLILGGGLGILLDRACFGQVTDFLDVYLNDYHWPAFNIADMAISSGVAILFLHFLPIRTKKA